MIVTNDYPLTFNIDNTVSGKHAQWYFLMTPETSVLVRSLLSDIMLCHPLSWCSWYHALVRRLTVYTVSSIAYSIASLLISSVHILMTIQIYLVKEKMSLLCWLSSSSRKVIEHLPTCHYPSPPCLLHFWVTSETELVFMRLWVLTVVITCTSQRDPVSSYIVVKILS